MANDEKNIIDRLFADSLGEAEMPVSNDLWKGIAAEMETGRLRKKVFFARITAAASLLLLLGFSTWFFVSSSFQNKGGTLLTTSGEVISLPYKTPNPNSSGNIAMGNSQFVEDSAECIDEPLREEALDQRFAVAQNENLSPLSKRPSAGLDLSAFFIDQYGPSANLRNREDRSFGQFGNQVNTNLNGNIQVNNTLTQANGNGLVNQTVSNQLTPNLKDQETVVELLAENQDLELNPDGIQELNADYELEDRVLIETVNPLASLISKDDINQILQANNRTEAIIASNFNFDQKQDKGAEGRWAFGGAFAPDYAFSSASPIQNQLNSSSRTVELQDPTEAQKSNSSLVTAFTTGLNLSYKISERLGVQSGLFYSNRKSTTTSDVSSFGKSLIINSDFSLNQLEIPMLLQYSIVKRDHLDYYVSSGVSANLLWNYNNTISNAQGQVAARVVSQEENTLQPSQGNFVLRTGIRYKLFNKVSLNLEPGLRYGILTNKYSFATGKPLSLSLNSGVNYHF